MFRVVGSLPPVEKIGVNLKYGSRLRQDSLRRRTMVVESRKSKSSSVA